MSSPSATRDPRISIRAPRARDATAMPSTVEASLRAVTAGKGAVTGDQRGGFSSIARAESSKCCTACCGSVRCGGRSTWRLNAEADNEAERPSVRERSRSDASEGLRQRLVCGLPRSRRPARPRAARKSELSGARRAARDRAPGRLPTATLAGVQLAAQVRFATQVPALPRSCHWTTASIQVCSSAAAFLLLQSQNGFQILRISCVPGYLQRFDNTCLTMRSTFAAEAAVRSSDSGLRHAPGCDPESCATS